MATIGVALDVERARVSVLRTALAWYADRGNMHAAKHGRAPLITDGGRRAREALAVTALTDDEVQFLGGRGLT